MDQRTLKVKTGSGSKANDIKTGSGSKDNEIKNRKWIKGNKKQEVDANLLFPVLPDLHFVQKLEACPPTFLRPPQWSPGHPGKGIYTHGMLSLLYKYYQSKHDVMSPVKCSMVISCKDTNVPEIQLVQEC